MYRFFSFRLTDPPLPVTHYTKEHPEVRVIAYNGGRQADIPLPVENYYVVRAPQRLHDEIDALFRENLDVIQEISTPEPGVRIYHSRFKFPDKGPVRGFLKVLTEAVGTILEFRPIVMERGMLIVSMLSLPLSDSVLRIRALEAYAAENKLGFQMIENRPVPTLPIVTPRQVTLDLMEWQVVQALDAAGYYEPSSETDRHVLRNVVADLADALGMDDEEVDAIRVAAEKKVLHEFSQVHKRNVELATPPARTDRTDRPEPPVPEA